MKLTALVFATLFATNLLSAQSFAGVYNYDKDTCCFSQVEWEITCRTEFESIGKGSVWLRFPEYRMSVANAKYQQNGKQYSPSDLGLASWPKIYADETTDYIKVDIKVFYKGKLVKEIPGVQLTPEGLRLANGFGVGNGKSRLYFGNMAIPKEQFDILQLSISLTNFSNGGINPGGDQLAQLVNKKEKL